MHSISRLMRPVVPMVSRQLDGNLHLLTKVTAVSFKQFSSVPTDNIRQEQNIKSTLVDPKKIVDSLNTVVETKYKEHPFSKEITRENIERVLGSYLAMSEAFPFLQAGAYKDLIFDCIFRNKGVSKEMEESFVVGAFLSFDETGGNYLLRTKGIQALPQLLDTNLNFHAALLKKDIQSVFAKNILPNYKNPTDLYLIRLTQGLGSRDPVLRCATMVAFEMHAGQMIEALWNSLSGLYPEKDKESLEYFKVHVGGDDPQEEYHKLLTQKMVGSSIAPTDEARFLLAFEESYGLNFQWCSDICKSERLQNTPLSFPRLPHLDP